MKPIGKAGEPGDPKLKSLFGKNKGKKKTEKDKKKRMKKIKGLGRPGYAVGGEVMPKAKPC